MAHYGKRIQINMSGKLGALFADEVQRQRDLFGHMSESEVAARLLHKALTMPRTPYAGQAQTAIDAQTIDNMV